MPIRPLAVFDIPSLGQYRQSAVVLDSARYLTGGHPLEIGGMLVHLSPRQQVYTAICNQEKITALGQVARYRNESFARLTFLAPEEGQEVVISLCAHLATQAGRWGMWYLVAEVEESSLLFRSLRLVGFSVYAWQRIWKLPTNPSGLALAPLWQPLRRADLATVLSLYNQIVPSLLQAIDPPPRAGEGLTCQLTGTMNAYVRIRAGRRGVWAQPLIHPDSTCTPEHLMAFARHLSPSGVRPTYLCVRSYQAWLETLLGDLGATAGPRQAVMVKRLVVAQKAEPAVKQKVWAKPAAPLTRSGS